MADEATAPLGAEPVTQIAPTTDSGSPAQQPEQTASDLNPDGLYRIPGQDKPVKLSEYVRGFQAQATKASQRAAELERKFKEADEARQRYEAQARQNQPQSQTGPRQDPFAAIREKAYLTGAETADAIGSVASTLAQEINVRDQILLAALKHIQNLQQTVGPLHQSNQMSAFDSKIAGWIKEGGYPEEYTELAKEWYLAYEPGPELDAEFPEILARNVAAAEKALENKRRAAAEAARRAPFVPGKGGNAHPSKPFKLDPRNSARADADALWEAMHAGAST